MNDGKKICSRCGCEKGLEEFYINKTGPYIGKPFSSCKVCIQITRHGGTVVSINVCETGYFRCTKCKTVKPLSEFYIRKSGSRAGKPRSHCIVCQANNHQEHKEERNDRSKKYYHENVEEIKAYNKQHRPLTREADRARHKAWKLKNIEVVREKGRIYVAKRLKTDPIYRFKSNVRNMIRNAIYRGGYSKNDRTQNILGCTYQEFLNHIIAKFEPEMTLDNYGDWHIDHIIPIASGITEEEILKLNHYTNLQPLWAADNLAKHTKTPEEWEKFKKDREILQVNIKNEEVSSPETNKDLCKTT